MIDAIKRNDDGTVMVSATATSKKHGTVDVVFLFEVAAYVPNRSSQINARLVTPGLVLAGQTSGYRADGSSVANSSTDNGVIKFWSKKELTRFGTNVIIVYREGDEQTKANRFVVDMPNGKEIITMLFPSQAPRVEVGEALRAAREEAGMSQTELAAKAGIDQCNLSKIENGVYNTTVDILVKIATALDKKVAFVNKI